MNTKLEQMFNAQSIAIVGASETPGKAGERRTRSLLQGGFQGRIYPVNPKRENIFSLRSYPNLKDIQDNIDLVVVITPVDAILAAVSDSIDKKASGAVIITAGLGETGEVGKRTEREILELLKRDGVRVIGPNCSGIYNAPNNINLLGIPSVQRGPFSIVAQSGNVIDSLCHYARLKNMGFSKIASAGNAIDVGFAEYLEFLGNDPDTKAILLYMEGLTDGGRFVQIAREVSKVKPIVAIKAGRSEAGKRAASTHTGSVAGDDLIVETAFNQAGIMRAYSIDEMFDMAKALVELPKPKGRQVVVLSEGGGDNAITVDNVAMQGLEVNVLSAETQNKLKPFILEGLVPSNPVDYGGKAEENPHKIIPACCEVCLEDDNVDIAIISGFFGGFKEIIAPHIEDFEKETSQRLVDLVKKYQKPILVNSGFANETIASLSILERGGIPVVASSERVARCANTITRAVENQRRFNVEELIRREPAPESSIQALIEEVKQKRSNMTEIESRKVLAQYAIPTPLAYLARSVEEAVKAAEELGYPVVMKISSPSIIHKTDMGGVKVNLRTSEEIQTEFNLIMSKAREVTSSIDGVLVLPMMPPGVECIIGMVRDKHFGPVLMFGLGGIFTEVLRDFSMRVLPVTQNDIDEMIRSIRGFPLLDGARGRNKKDLAALHDILQKVSEIAIDYPDIEEIDLNPVVAYEAGACALDARIIVRR
ncbi:MAG TPA: acetate--CoA ligase family protein [Dehalococcoidia bacterium]|nr:acetate--CoA ligase family protein [Dehalococcoidia bacterium]